MSQSTQYDPFIPYSNIPKGTKLTIPRLGKCEFYRFSPKKQKIEVFDKYGILRYVTMEEIHELPDSAIERP